MTEDEILSHLDNYKWGYYCQFIDLGHGYSYLIDCRLNIFKKGGEWAVAAERLGYNPRGGRIELDICYVGNCLTNLEHYNGQDTNYYTVYPVDEERFWATVEGEALIADATSWLVRGQQIDLSRRKQDYTDAGIELKEYEPGEIKVEEVGRWLITKHRDLLRATDEELYKSIPRHLKKILVLDEWYHRDFNEIDQPPVSDAQLRASYELTKQFREKDQEMDFDSFVALFRSQEQSTNSYNQDQRESNRPSAYETWQLLAKVIATGDLSMYKPTLVPNTHWKFWPESGSL